MTSSRPEESVDSIIREATAEEDKKKIVQALNRCIERGVGITGGGIRIYEPYTFHEDEPRRVCVYTIPYVLDDRCPVLRGLVNMLWSTVDASKNLDKVDRVFVNQTQRFLDDFNKSCHVSANHLDLFGAIEGYLQEAAPPEDKEKTKSTMERVIGRFKQRWDEFKKPVVSSNVSAMNLLLKLYRSLGNREYKTSTIPSKFHNVLVLAYDTGADNRYAITRLFKGARDPLLSCVAFTSMDGLDRSVLYNEASFESGFRYLHAKIQEEITRFLTFVPDKDIDRKMAEILERLHQIEVSVRELKDLREEQGKSDEIARKLKEMLDFSHKMEEGGTLDEKEGKGIVEGMETVLKRLTESETSMGGSEGEESEHLRKHMVEMKKKIADQAKAIKELMEYRDKSLTVQESIAAAKGEWIQRVNEIEEFSNSLRRDEEHLKEIAEKSTKDFVMEQYNKANWFGRICLRQAFPFIGGLKK